MMSKRTASSASGFWLALPQAVLMLMVARQGCSRSAIEETKPGVSTAGRDGLPS